MRSSSEATEPPTPSPADPGQDRGGGEGRVHHPLELPEERAGLSRATDQEEPAKERAEKTEPG